jgi:hypothetical protein
MLPNIFSSAGRDDDIGWSGPWGRQIIVNFSTLLAYGFRQQYHQNSHIRGKRGQKNWQKRSIIFNLITTVAWVECSASPKHPKSSNFKIIKIKIKIEKLQKVNKNSIFFP